MPDKSPDAFRTISEVADWLGVQPHVLRFWESKFSQVRPVKRAGGRRYYRPGDMLLLGGIRKLLHEDGLTIKGAQKVLREEGMSHVARLSQPLDSESAALSEVMESDDAVVVEPPAEDTGQVVEFDLTRSRPDPAQEPAGPEAIEPQGDATSGAGLPDEAQSPAASTDHDTLPDMDGPEEQEAPAASGLPSFMRNPATRKPAVPEPPETSSLQSKPDTGASDRLPSFLHPPSTREDAQEDVESTSADDPVADLDKTAAQAQKPEDASKTAAVTPQPRIVDAPDPDESAIEVSSGALSAAFSATTLPSERLAELMPLVAQLAALRDRMASAQRR